MDGKICECSAQDATFPLDRSLMRTSHRNAIDKTPEGDLIFPAWHPDAIFKVYDEDSSIIWRLGGVKSDIHVPDKVVFSRQHDVQYCGQNDRHTFLSTLENSKGQDSK